uniref:Uncharacterized protein n=1 Tax=Haptolina ericina TaxID=156174 RepID=A0A7S3AF94_9EUKA|mmetsp:Transcript_15910/g.35619  ORF Transcript_15910/g.35619 Transcript_15910/m.35619 type:complete len:115 (+) Transcript_15910:367-711(+)
MQKFYHAASAKWNDLPAWNTSRQAVAPNSKRGMKGFRVSKLPLAASRARLQKEALPELSEAAQPARGSSCSAWRQSGGPQQGGSDGSGGEQARRHAFPGSMSHERVLCWGLVAG